MTDSHTDSESGDEPTSTSDDDATIPTSEDLSGDSSDCRYEEPTLPPSDSASNSDDATLPPADSAATLAPDTFAAEIPPESEAAQAIAGDRLRYFGDYELIDEIARGGMGVVFRARQVNLNRVVALKMILAGQFAGREDIQRFYTEAEAAAQLDHWGIVPIFEIGEHNNQHYFSMAFVEGESLQEKIRSGPMDPGEAVKLCAKISQAIAYAHEKGVIHRDLKPANILMDRDGTPKVTDFGLAKQVESNSDLTRTGAVMGTPSFMPPEQAGGKTEAVGEQADVYSLGAILYCLITGRPPFQAANTMDTLIQVLEKEPVPPKTLNHTINQDIQTVTLKCLEKDPAKRYQTAAELADELTRCANGDPILARPVSRTEKTFRWCRRNPMVASLIGAIAATFLFVAVGGYLAAYQMNELRNEADSKRGIAETLAEKNRILALGEAEQKQIAIEKQQEAETLAEKNRKQLLATRLMQADERIDREEDAASALPFYLDALQLDVGNEEESRNHRIRIQSAIASIPKITHFWTHSDSVNRMAVSQDGSMIATCSHDRTVQIREIQSSELVCEPLEHSLPVWNCAFSPDGKRVVTASGSGLAGSLQIWEVSSGEKVGKPIEMTANPFGVMWSEDEKIAAISTSFAEEASCNTYDVKEQRLLHSESFYGVGNPTLKNVLAHIPSGKFLQIRPGASDPGISRLIDFNRGNVISTLNQEDPVITAAFNQDGSFIATASASGVAVWDTQSGEVLWSVPRASFDEADIRITSDTLFHFSFDNRTVIGADANLVFELTERGQVQRVSRPGITGKSLSMISPSGKWVAIADGDASLRLWDVGLERFEPFAMKHSAMLQFAEFLDDGRRIVTACVDGTVRIWDLATQDLQIAKRYYHNNRPVFLQVLEDRGEMITRGYNWVRLTDLESGNGWFSYLGNNVRWVSSPDSGDLVAHGTGAGEVIITNRRDQEKVATLKYERPIVRQVDLSGNGKLVASISVVNATGPGQISGIGMVREVETGKTIAGPLRFNESTITSLLSRLASVNDAFDMSGVATIQIGPDSRTVAYGGGRIDLSQGKVIPKIRLLDLEDEQERELEFGDGERWQFVQKLQFSKSGKRLLAVGDNPVTEANAEARVFDCESGETILGPLRFVRRFSEMTFSPKEDFVAVAVGDKVHVYDLETGEQSCAALSHPATVTQLAFSPRGQIATGAGDQAVRVWDVKSGRLLAPPMRHPFPINNLALPKNNRLYICSDQNVYVRELGSGQGSPDSISQTIRLLANQTLSSDDSGLISAKREQLEDDWAAQSSQADQAFAVTDDQIEQWYRRLLNQLHRDRDWSSLTFHREQYIKRHPGDGFVLRLQANAYGENGQFKRAAGYLKSSLDLESDDTWSMFQRCSALLADRDIASSDLAAGDNDPLSDLFETYIATAKDSSDPFVAERLGKLLLIANHPSEDASLPHRLADIAIEAQPSNGWFIITKALSLTRSGDHSTSIEKCDLVINSSMQNILRPLAFAVRSIAHAKFGNLDAAQSDLQAVGEHRKRLNIDQTTGLWHDRIHLDILTNEAAAALADVEIDDTSL